MLENVGWFVVAYACVSITVTIIMVVAAKKAFRLRGPIDMVRGAFLLIVAVIGFIIWVAKAVAGHSDGSPNDQIKRTIRRTSSWMDSLKDEWEGGKDGGNVSVTRTPTKKRTSTARPVAPKKGARRHWDRIQEQEATCSKCGGTGFRLSEGKITLLICRSCGHVLAEGQ